MLAGARQIAMANLWYDSDQIIPAAYFLDPLADEPADQTANMAGTPGIDGRITLHRDDLAACSLAQSPTAALLPSAVSVLPT